MGILENIISYDLFYPLNEGETPYKKGGVILIFGKELDDKTRRLHASYIKDVIHYPRTKIDSSPGSPVKMVILEDDFYRIEMDPSGSFKALKMSGGPKAIGAIGNKIALNNKKTPYHWLSSNYQSLPQLFSGMGLILKSIPGIRWKG